MDWKDNVFNFNLHCDITAFGLLKQWCKSQTKVSQFEHSIIKHIYKVEGSKSWTAWHTKNQQATRNVSESCLQNWNVS